MIYIAGYYTWGTKLYDPSINYKFFQFPNPMQTILLTAAHTTPYLPELVEEIRAIEDALRPLEERGIWKVISNRAANLEDVFEVFTREQQNIKIFHYAGHASQTELFLEGGGHIRGIAGLMGMAEPEDTGINPLYFVFLNGCASKGLIAQLHQAGISAVMATHCKIGDLSARKFATQFYKTWAMEGKTLKQAFLIAKNFLLSDPDDALLDIEIRGLDLSKEESKEGLAWGLYPNPKLKNNIENFQINPQIKLPRHILDNVKTVASECVMDLVYDFEQLFPDAQEEIQRQGDPLVVLISRLPWTIGTHLRRLFALDDSNSMYLPGIERLRELISAYHELTRFMAYLSLSTLWDELRRNTLSKEEVKVLPLVPSDTERTVDFVWRLRKYFALQKDKRVDRSGVKQHLKTFLEAVDGELNNAYLFMEELKAALQKDDSPERLNELVLIRTGKPDGLEDICLQAETIYTHFLSASLWLTQFRLYTVRSVLVDKIRYLELKTPYVHRTMSLHFAFGELKLLRTQREIASDNACILMVPIREGEADPLADAINLSPFYIDRSAYIEDNITHHPVIYVLKHQNVDGGYIYEYLDEDVNHEYLYKEDQYLKIRFSGAVFAKALKVKTEDSRRFSVIHQQLIKLNENFAIQ